MVAWIHLAEHAASYFERAHQCVVTAEVWEYAALLADQIARHLLGHSIGTGSARRSARHTHFRFCALDATFEPDDTEGMRLHAFAEPPGDEVE